MRCKPGTRREPWGCWWLPSRVTAAPDGWHLATEPWQDLFGAARAKQGIKGHQMATAMRLLWGSCCCHHQESMRGAGREPPRRARQQNLAAAAVLMSLRVKDPANKAAGREQGAFAKAVCFH